MANCLRCLADVVPKDGRWNVWSGKCCSHLLNCVWQMLCLSITEGITTVKKSETYFNLIPEVLKRTSSQICNRLYFSMFLLRYELLSLMYIDSFIFLGWFWSSLLTILPLYWNFQLLWYDQWFYCGNKLGRGPWSVLSKILLGVYKYGVTLVYINGV